MRSGLTRDTPTLLALLLLFGVLLGGLWVAGSDQIKYQCAHPEEFPRFDTSNCKH